MEKDMWGRRIRAYRKLKGYTQEGFAKRLGISVSVLGEIERGNRLPTNQLVGQIADALNITVEELSPILEEERRGKMFKIGDIEIKNKVVLAPMAGVCNSAFRLTVKEFGAGLVCAEMVSDKAILINNARTMGMLYIDEREKPLSLQIFGGEKDTLVEAAKFVDQNTTADIIDINMGCPVPKITKCDAGAKWPLIQTRFMKWSLLS